MSASSCPGNHLSSSAPQLCHHTRNWWPLPQMHSSKIHSINHSCLPSGVITGLGWDNFREGKRLLSLGTNWWSSDEWKLVKRLGLLGSSSVYEDLVGFTFVTMKGLSNRGMNLAMWPNLACMYSHLQCSIDNQTLSPGEKTSSSVQCWFANSAWFSFALSRSSWASMTSVLIRLMRARAAIHSSSSLARCPAVCGMMGGIRHGKWPIRNWKGENPVELFTVFIIWKHTKGRALAQPVWLRSTLKWRHCMTILFDHSLEPSVLGWYAEDILSLTPVSFVSAFQNLLTKSLSRSLTMLSGRPFLQYHRSKNWAANRSAVERGDQARNEEEMRIDMMECCLQQGD